MNCLLFGCENPPKVWPLCHAHGERLRRNGTTYSRSKDMNDSCLRCDSPALANSLCRMHYMRVKRTGAVGPSDKLARRECVACGETGDCTHKRREKHYMKRYGIRLAEYEAVMETFANRCGICDRDVPRLNLDHDHETGQIRGALCFHCNTGLEWLMSVPGLFDRAMDYLTNSPSMCSEVLGKGCERP